MIGGAIAVCLWARWRGFLGVALFDLCAPALALGNAIGRVGCQLSGDGDYGHATGMPWGMAYPEGTVRTLQEVHPTPIFETLAMGLIALALWQLRDRVKPGGLFALYLVLAGFERLLIEFIRRNDDFVARADRGAADQRRDDPRRRLLARAAAQRRRPAVTRGLTRR